MYLTLKSAIALRCHYLKCIYTVKTAILNIRIFLLKLDILAFTVVRTTTTNFKVIVHSNLVVRYFIHCGKTTISNFKLLIHLNLVGGQYTFHCQSNSRHSKHSIVILHISTILNHFVYIIYLATATIL